MSSFAPRSSHLSRRLFCLAPLLAVTGCTSGTAAKPGAETSEASVPSVGVARVRTGVLERKITLPGTIRAYQEATVYAKVAGYLKAIAVDRGDRVKAGQVLAELEVPELQAEIGKLRAELDAAEIERTRLVQAAERAPDLVTPQAVDTVKAKREVALANLERAETLMECAKLTAPFSGVVTRRYVDPGAFIPAATSSGPARSAAVVTVMDFSRVRIDVAMPEAEVPRVEVGLPASVSVAELSGRTFEGEVTRIAYALDEATKTMGTEIELPNPDAALRPGMYASVTTRLERREGALLVPAQAILTQKGLSFAFRVKDGRAQKVAVRPGLDDGIHVEVRDGLSADDLVVVSGSQSLADGQACRPVEVQ
jgi:membrane fusion protein (multidrug efflux system)